MKLFRIVTLALLIPVSMVGQGLKLGPIAGFSSPDLNLSNSVDQSFIETIQTKPGAGFHVGMWGRLSLPGVFLQTELLYHQLNGDLQVVESSGPEYQGEYNIKRIDLPVHLGFKVGPVGLFAGPVVSSYLTSYQADLKVLTQDPVLGGNAGLQINLGKFLFQGRYEFSMGEKEGEIRINTSGGDKVIKIDARVPIFVFSIGYSLL